MAQIAQAKVLDTQKKPRRKRAVIRTSNGGPPTANGWISSSVVSLCLRMYMWAGWAYLPFPPLHLLLQAGCFTVSFPCRSSLGCNYGQLEFRSMLLLS